MGDSSTERRQPHHVVGVANIRRELSRCHDWLEAALAHSAFGLTMVDVERMLVSEPGIYRLWPGKTGATITELSGNRLNFWLAGGDMAEMEHLETGIAGWAKAQGVTELMFFGRRGWERSFLRGRGYEAKHTVMVKQLWAD